MKTAFPALALLLALPAFAAQGKGFVYKDNQGDVSIRANSGSGAFDGPRIRFDISGNVVAASRAQELGITASRMTGVVEPDPIRKGARRLGDVKASGGVVIIRTRTEKGPKGAQTGRTEARGNTATYDAGATDSATATLVGNAVIIDDFGPRKVNLLGDSGKANFSTVQGTDSPLKSATMTGNVRVKVTQINDAGVANVYNASGDRMDYASSTSGGTLTLSGDVKLDSPGEAGGDVQGVRRAVLTLNAKGELSRVNFFTDDSSASTPTPAGRIRTTFRLKPTVPKAPKPAGTTKRKP